MRRRGNNPYKGDKSMKVLFISSSPHREKSRTYLLAKGILQGLAQEGVDCETVHLEGLRIFFCKHCEACHRQLLHCSAADDVAGILKNMLDADGIILASPNYINQVNAVLKALFDRSAHFIHCKRLWGKYIAAAVSSGSGQNKEVLDYIKYYAHTCGAQYSGGVSCGAQPDAQSAEEAVKLGRHLAGDIREKKAYPRQLEIIEQGKRHFAQIIKLRKDDWRQEYKYWLDKGWL